MVLFPSKRYYSSCLKGIVVENMKKRLKIYYLYNSFFFFFGKAKLVLLLSSLDMIKRLKELEVYLQLEVSWCCMLY
jgi:hypothetical protein